MYYECLLKTSKQVFISVGVDTYDFSAHAPSTLQPTLEEELELESVNGFYTVH